MEKRPRTSLTAIVAVVILSSSLIAQTPAGQPPPAASNVDKIMNVPDVVTRRDADVRIPNEYVDPGLQELREEFGEGRYGLADGLHKALTDAGLDVSNGDVSTDDNGNVTVAFTGPEGTLTITAHATETRVVLQKILWLDVPFAAPIVFHYGPPRPKPVPPAATPSPPSPIQTIPMSPTTPSLPGGSFIEIFPPGSNVNPDTPSFVPVTPGAAPAIQVPGPGRVTIELTPPKTTTGAVPSGPPPVVPVPPTAPPPPPTITIPSILTPTSSVGQVPAPPVQPNPEVGEREKVPSARDPWAILQQTPGTLIDRVQVTPTPVGASSTPAGTSGSPPDRPGNTPPWGPPTLEDDLEMLDRAGVSLIPNLSFLGNTRDGREVINALKPLRYDPGSQYKVASFAIQESTQPGGGMANWLHAFLFRQPNAARGFGSASPLRPFGGRIPALSRRSSTRARAPVTVLLTSLGKSTGETFHVQVLSEGPVDIKADALVIEPLTGVQPQAIARAAKVFDSRGAQTATAVGYCLELAKQPPTAGMLYRIAPPAVQKRFESLRRVVRAARHLNETGQFQPDSDPTAYGHSISQWAVWASEQNFTLEGFSRALVEHTKKNVVGSGRQWRQEMAEAVEKVVPHRWREIQKVLQLAGQ